MTVKKECENTLADPHRAFKHSDSPVDLTPRVRSMNRDESILWADRRKAQERANPKRPDFHGIVRLSGGVGHYYRIVLWCRHERVWRANFLPCKEVFRTGVPPSQDQTVKKICLFQSRSEPGIWRGSTGKARVELAPAVCGGREVWWLKLMPRKEGG
jgi:hypothetical protein